MVTTPVMTKSALMCAFVVGSFGAVLASGFTAGADRVRTTPTTVAITPDAADAATTTVGLATPENESSDPVRVLLPSVAVAEEVLTDREDQEALIASALTGGTHTVAVEAEPGTICAVIPVVQPVMAEGRWERNGAPIGTGVEQRRDPPGYGECIPNENGEAFREGVYQFVAIGPTGAVSAAASVVVGRAPVDLLLLNNGDEPVCLVLMSPAPADYYGAHDTETPLLPGEAMSIPAAPVDHDVRVFGCPPDEPRRTFTATPASATYVPMFEDETAEPDPTAQTTAAAGSTIP